MKDNRAVNRAKLVDEPIVEMILSRRYLKSGIKFMKSDLETDFDGTDIICYSNGLKRSLNVKRNSSKYYNSPNFSITLNKNKMNSFKSTSFVFIDEVSDSLYIVDGEVLLKYIIENSRNLRSSDDNGVKFWIIIPKKDILSLISDNPNSIIKYNKQVARLFELGRNEDQYKELV